MLSVCRNCEIIKSRQNLSSYLLISLWEKPLKFTLTNFEICIIIKYSQYAM